MWHSFTTRMRQRDRELAAARRHGAVCSVSWPPIAQPTRWCSSPPQPPPCGGGEPTYYFDQLARAHNLPVVLDPGNGSSALGIVVAAATLPITMRTPR
jgi:hypothetical protein